ncbi:MAG TPA: MFS transporter [Thermoanaerobaculia bacterium]|jgi:MFS family permease
MKTFRIIWLGQLLSLLGSGLNAFALGVWVYQQTGSTTRFALVLFSGSLPGVLLLPVAGLLADRWDRRLTMVLSDAGAGLGALALALMFATGRVSIGWIYLLLIFSSSLATFQRPAYSAAVGQFVSKDDLTRANGMVRTAQAVAQLFAPLLAGLLLSFLSIGTILFLDVASFGVALATLLAVRFPEMPSGEPQVGGAASWRREIAQGFSYIGARQGLLSLMVFFAVLNFAGSCANALVQPLILSFASPRALGTMLTTAGIGLLVGSVVMSVWGGPKRRVLGIFGFMPLAGAGILLAGLRPSIPVVVAGLILAFFSLPFIEGATTAIVQSKVDPKVQGRVFAVTHVIASGLAPIAYVIAGLLSDRVFEPLMAPGGALAPVFGPFLGVGKGRGMGLILLLVGVVLLLTTAIGALLPRLRNVEDDLPDAVPATPSPLPLPVDGLELT